MSRMEHYKGKLVKVELLENESLEEQCKRIIENSSGECDLDEIGYDKYSEVVRYEMDYECVIIDGILYKIENLEEQPISDSFYNLTKNEDGNYNFEVKYYNGGCCFEEAVNIAFHKYEKKKIN